MVMRKIGTLMSAVIGVAPKKMSYAEKQKITPKFQRDCNSLNVLMLFAMRETIDQEIILVRLNSKGEVDLTGSF